MYIHEYTDVYAMDSVYTLRTLCQCIYNDVNALSCRWQCIYTIQCIYIIMNMYIHVDVYTLSCKCPSIYTTDCIYICALMYIHLLMYIHCDVNGNVYAPFNVYTRCICTCWCIHVSNLMYMNTKKKLYPKQTCITPYKM